MRELVKGLAIRAALSLVAVTVVAVSIGACGKSVEGETKSWQTNKIALEKYAGKYAGLKEAINKHIADAQKQYDEAQKISDEDQKAKALSLANQQLLLVIKPLDKLDKTMARVEALKKDAGIMKLSAGEVNPAIKLADQGLEKAKSLLADAKGVSTGGELVGKVEEANRAATNGAAELEALKKKVDAASKPAAKPAGDKPAADKPAGDKPAADKPAGDKPAADKPAADKPATDKPAAGDKPAEKPAK